MTSSSKKTPVKSNSVGIPKWIQVAIGLALLVFIYMVSTMGPLYSSDWFEENSSFYQNSSAALSHFSINPSAPTLVIFWERECVACKESLKVLRTAHPSLRIYGVHVPIGEENKAQTSKVWARSAPKRAALIYDRSEMLRSSFGVKGVPRSTLILPKQKKMYSYIGNIKHNKKELIKLIKSEL